MLSNRYDRHITRCMAAGAVMFVIVLVAGPHLPRSVNIALAMATLVLLVIAARPFITHSRTVPAEHLPPPAPPRAPRAARPDPFATIRQPPPGIDPATGEVLPTSQQSRSGPTAAEQAQEQPRPQPSRSAATAPQEPPLTPSPADNPIATEPEPHAAPVGLGTFVRWTKADRTGTGQIISIGTEAAEIRPCYPCPTKQITVPLDDLTPIPAHHLAEALT